MRKALMSHLERNSDRGTIFLAALETVLARVSTLGHWKRLYFLLPSPRHLFHLYLPKKRATLTSRTRIDRSCWPLIY